MRKKILYFVMWGVMVAGCGGGGSGATTQAPSVVDDNTTTPTDDGSATPSPTNEEIATIIEESNCTLTLTPNDDLQKSIDNATSGAVICLESGLYEPKSFRIEAKENLTLKGLTPPNKGDETTTGARFTGKESGDDYYGLIEIVNSKGVRVANLTIEDAEIEEGVGILVRGSSDIILYNNLIMRTNSSGILLLADVDRSTTPTTITQFNSNIAISSNKILQSNTGGANSGNEAISVSGTNGFEVSYNEVTHRDKSGKLDGFKEGIDLKDGSRNGTVHNNSLHDVSKTCIYVDGWEHHTYNIEIYQNNINGCGVGGVRGTGISVASERNGEVENIFIHDNFITNVKVEYYSGIHIATGSGEAGYDENPIHNIAIVNNTVHDNYSGIMVSENFTNFKSFANILIANNLVDMVNTTGGYLLGAKNIEYTTRNGNAIGSPYAVSRYTQDDFTILHNALRPFKERGWDEYSDLRESAIGSLKLTGSPSLVTALPTATQPLQTTTDGLKDKGADITSTIEGFSDVGGETMPQGEVTLFVNNFKKHYEEDFNHKKRTDGVIDIGAVEGE